MSQSNYVWLEDCLVTMVTDKAVQVVYDGSTHWLPKSQLADKVDYETGGTYTIGITEWLANEKGIEE